MSTPPKLVILPWRSEYGTMLMHHVRWVHSLQASSKVVWCRRGNEILFPSATAFRFGWLEPPDEQKNTRLFRSPEHLKYMKELEAKCQAEYPDHIVLHPQPKQPYRPDVVMKLESGKLDRRVDVVLAPRFRRHGLNRNFPHWQELADGLRARGHVVGLTGFRSTSLDLHGIPEDLKGWNLGGDREQLQLMNSAQVTVTTDSGVAHLAVLNQNPLMVLYDRPGRDGSGTAFPWTIPHMQAHAKALCEPLVWCWHDPKRAIDLISNFLSTGSIHGLSPSSSSHRPAPVDSEQGE